MISMSPTIAECLQLMEEHAMLPNIREHSFVVARVAEHILDRLSSHPGATTLPDKKLVTAGALLHDIAKSRCLNGACDHAEVGSAICRQYGYSEVAEIVEEHVRLRTFALNRYRVGAFEAKEIIFYADKRVVHDQIVSLDERLDYILARYGRNDPVRCKRIHSNFSKCQTLEKYICHNIGCTPVELLHALPISPYTAGVS
ncbi:MAG: HDIG domain-containing metalloprotein [Desulfopila sp.]|jgi:putative nucleotidyltransferase with HDIG domain|nr:HDIG domain-containing metalloprotein [Desulfopila sp.]